MLAGIVLGKGENGVVSMRYEDLTARIQAKMSQGYSLQFAGDAKASVHKGKLESIELSTAKRSGNKSVTLIHNLEVFRINPAEFATREPVAIRHHAAARGVQESAKGHHGHGGRDQEERETLMMRLFCDNFVTLVRFLTTFL